jgi:predicted RNA-binding Zn-ribbon protein involved in translation (DUF1610 family)
MEDIIVTPGNKTVEINKEGEEHLFSCPNCGQSITLWNNTYEGEETYCMAMFETYKFMGFKYYTKSFCDVCTNCGTMYAFKIEVKYKDPDLNPNENLYWTQKAKKLQEQFEDDCDSFDGQMANMVLSEAGV